MAEWRECVIGDLCNTVSDTYKGNDEYVVLVNTSDVLEGKVLNHCLVENKNLKGQFKKTFKKNDILYSEIRPANKRFAFIDFENTSHYIASTKLMVLRHNEKVLPEFLFALLKSNYVISELQHLAETRSGTFPQITFSSELAPMRVNVPDKETQKKIVSVLSSIEEKININNQVNNNLQQQVQAIFTDWLAKHINDSDEVSLGEICAKVTDGSHFSPKDEPTSNIPMLSVKDMGKFDFNLTSCKHISEVDYQKMVANDCVPQINDILVAKDGSYLKEIFICNEERQLAILSSIAIFRADTLKICPEILLAFLKSPRVLQEVRDNYVSGSALPRIVLKDFKKLRFLLPNMDAQLKIAELLSSIRFQMAVNEAESNRLAQLRDALLPKLMSGKLDVSNIDL